MSAETEKPDIGERSLVTGVLPITVRDRLAVKVRQPIRPKRNPHAPQNPCDLGLFDEVGRAQIDIFNLIKSNKEA